MYWRFSERLGFYDVLITLRYSQIILALNQIGKYVV